VAAGAGPLDPAFHGLGALFVVDETVEQDALAFLELIRRRALADDALARARAAGEAPLAMQASAGGPVLRPLQAPHVIGDVAHPHVVTVVFVAVAFGRHARRQAID